MKLIIGFKVFGGGMREEVFEGKDEAECLREWRISKYSEVSCNYSRWEEGEEWWEGNGEDLF